MRISRQVRIAAVLISIAAALCFGFVTYVGTLSNTREALLDSSKDLADQGEYREAVKLIDRALALDNDDTVSDEVLCLRKAEYLQKAGEPDQALMAAMRVVKNTSEGQEEFDEAWERIVSICTEQGEYGKLAKERVRVHYSWDHIVTEYEKLFLEQA